LIVAVSLLTSAVLVIPGWIPLLPRSTRRGLTEALLRTVMFVYCGFFLVSVVATPILAVILVKARRARRSRPLCARCFLIGLSCLFSLILLELGSAVWSSWLHRFPALPTTFADVPAEEYRIVVLGGSSALGEPYRPWLSVGQIVAWRLQQEIPSSKFECEILAWLGDSLEMQHRKLAALVRRPGMVIIYSGHNEFAARYEEERDGWLDQEPGNPLLARLYHSSMKSPFCRLAYEIISKNRLDLPPPLSGRHQLIDPPQCSPAEAEEIRLDFEGRLEVITSYCVRIGAVPVLIVPPANEADYEPSRSVLPPSVTVEDRNQLVRDFGAARELEASDPAASADLYQRIIEQHPGFAEAHFRLARLLERSRRVDDAARHYLAALDHDGLPIRCQSSLRAAYVRVARRHPTSVLIDGPHELAAASPSGLLDDHVIQDTHHPTLVGYVTLAQAVMRELARKSVFGAALSGEHHLDPASCAAHFGMDSEKWATVCDRASEHYRRVAGYRYDPAERLGKSRRYAEAARQILNGVAPENLDMPGVGVKATSRSPGKEGADPSGTGAESGREQTTRAVIIGPGACVPASFRDSFDLPILEQDGRAPAEEVHDRDEVVLVRAPDDLADHAGERSGCDAHRRAHRNRGLLGDDQPRADHRVNLTEISRQGLLIGHFEDPDQAVAAKGRHPILVRAPHEHVAGEERHDRLDLSSRRRSALFSCLGKVVSDAGFAQVASGGFFLARLGVQAPPDGLFVPVEGRSIVPQVGRMAVVLSRKDWHRIARDQDRPALGCRLGSASIDWNFTESHANSSRRPRQARAAGPARSGEYVGAPAGCVCRDPREPARAISCRFLERVPAVAG
jgi:hypothetical protein